MSLHTNIVHVYYSNGVNKKSVGRLVYNNRKIFFEYTQEFLKTGIELSPFKLALKPGMLPSNDYTFDGLFGVFNDSLPDGWGRLLLDRKLMSLGINPENLTPLERLCYVGNHGMGALSYKPEVDQTTPAESNDLDLIADEALHFLEQDDEQFVDYLLAMNGSSAGARPKILVNIVNNYFQASDNKTTAPHNDWIIKFKSSTDPKDIGSIEYAYHLMAKAAGLELPESQLFKSKHCPGYFGVRRFDRVESKFFHIHTMSGLLHVDHRIPSLDYETIMKATLWLTKDTQECEKQLRNALFNVLSHNRDDHAKNFSFLMEENGQWKVSPAYDLTFSSGPAGEHCTTVMREGRNPKLTHFLKLAAVVGISKSKVFELVDQVKHAVFQWRTLAELANVTKKSCDRIEIALQRVADQF